MTESKAELARWLGYGPDPGAVQRMDLDHDHIHRALCRWLGLPDSYSLRAGRGEPLGRIEHDLANYEEDAVLWLTRFMVHAGLKPPG